MDGHHGWKRYPESYQHLLESMLFLVHVLSLVGIHSLLPVPPSGTLPQGCQNHSMSSIVAKLQLVEKVISRSSQDQRSKSRKFGAKTQNNLNKTTFGHVLLIFTF